jgi:hypothetical protein
MTRSEEEYRLNHLKALNRIAGTLERIADAMELTNAVSVRKDRPDFIGTAYTAGILTDVEKTLAARWGGDRNED